MRKWEPKKDWKEMIFQEVCMRDRPEDIPIPEDFEESIIYALSTLPENYSNLILMRYKQKKTFRECGESIGVTRERARVIIGRGIRMLRHKSRMPIILYGLNNCNKVKLDANGG